MKQIFLSSKFIIYKAFDLCLKFSKKGNYTIRTIVFLTIIKNVKNMVAKLYQSDILIIELYSKTLFKDPMKNCYSPNNYIFHVSPLRKEMEVLA